MVENKPRRLGEKLLYALIYLVSTGILLLTIYLIAVVFLRGLPALNLTLLSTAPNPIKQTVGIFPSIINTLYMVLFTLLLSVPVGVGGAIYLSEYARNQKLVNLIEFATEILTGIPSILYGVFGYIVFVQLFNFKVSLLSGILTLSMMILPLIFRTAQEALATVPQSYRDGALGMGATKWEMIRTILLPYSLRGILTGTILSTGRIISESAALLLVAGSSAMYMPQGNIFNQLLASGSTLSVELYRYAYSRGDNETAFAIAAILLIIVIGLNLATHLLAGRLKQI